MQTPQVQQQNNLQIKADDKTLVGLYSNAMQVQHSKEEFFMDFLNLFPPGGQLQARVFVSPGHMKRVVAALQENLDKYEAAYGKIDAAQDPGEIGFRAN